MTLHALLAYSSAVTSALVAFFVLLRGRASLANWIFIAGMAVLAIQSIFAGMTADAATSADVLRWEILRLRVSALIPGLWLVFGLSFARANDREFLWKWRWVLVAIFALPVLLAFWPEALFDGAFRDESFGWLLPLGWSGYTLHLVFLLSAVAILVNLEGTLRATTGGLRWQIKFMLLGVGSLFAVQIYISSQTLLYSAVHTKLSLVVSAALLFANVLIAVYLVRTKMVPVDVYPSETLLYRSLTVLIAGVYLLVVSVLAKFVSVLGEAQSLPLTAFLVLVALLILAMVLLSGKLQQRFKNLVSRHLRRPKYDYRHVWSAFTHRTSSLVDVEALCAAVAGMVSDTFGVGSATVWLVDETRDGLSFGGSSALTEQQAKALLSSGTADGLIEVVQHRTELVDLVMPDNPASSHLDSEFLRQSQIRHAAPLVSGGELVGLLTLSERITKEPYTLEDRDLLKTIAEQTAAALLNAQLSAELVHAKEMEAFQTLSAFFVHDLKNLASRLSLTLQNLPEHYDDPDFRKDLLRTISQSVDNINSLCSRLSPLSKELELSIVETELNALVSGTVTSLAGSTKANMVQDLGPAVTLPVDPDQIQKVLVNLILNAYEATDGAGEIRVTMENRNDWAVLSVSDEGCGMSTDFVENSLFKAFRTTKKKGLGIGLFHCKKIVEAHGGMIEVESLEGKGSVFRVLLPQTARKP